MIEPRGAAGRGQGSRPAAQPPAEVVSRSERPLADSAAALVRTVTRDLPVAVDELHVAAMLESRGITDQNARDEYGCDDVFALGAVVFRHLPGRPDTPEYSGARPPRRTLRAVTHGPLYVLPSAVYPAVFTVLGATAMVRGLVFATAVGWVWGLGMSAIAYQLLGEQRARAAARMLRLLSLMGLAVVLVGATGLALTGAGGPGMVAFAVAQMGFVLASGTLVFYGKEWWLAVLMLPACVAGVVHILSGYRAALVGPALIAGALSILLVLGAAWLMSVRAGPQPDPQRVVPWRRTWLGAVPSASYAALCAFFLLFTDFRYVVGQFDLAIAVAPLVLGMGAVEWRAHRFTEKVGELLQRTTFTADFRRAARYLLWSELTVCLLILGGLAGILAAVLISFGTLSFHGALLIDAHVLLGGTYFLGFVMARYGQFPWLIGILGGVVVVDLVAVGSVARRLEPHGEIPIFLSSTTMLLVLLLVRLSVSAGRVYQYR